MRIMLLPPLASTIVSGPLIYTVGQSSSWVQKRNGWTTTILQFLCIKAIDVDGNMGRNWWGGGKRMHEKEKRLIYGSCGEGEKTISKELLGRRKG